MSLEGVALQGPYLGGSFYVGNLLITLQERLVGGEAQRFRGKCQDVVLLHGEDGDVGGQTGLQFQVVVWCRDDNLVGHHIARRGGLLTNLCHRAFEFVVGESVNGERNALAFLHTTDVGLVNIGNHPHIGQVLGDGEQFRGVERGSNRLSFLYRFRQDNTVNRTGNGGVAQIGLCLAHALLRGCYRLAGLLVVQPVAFELVGADQSFLVQRLVSVVVGALIVQCALCRRQVGARAVQFADEVRLVKFGNDLSFLDDGVVVNVQVCHDAADLCADGDGGYGFDGSRSGNAGVDALTLHLGRFKLHFLFFLAS